MKKQIEKEYVAPWEKAFDRVLTPLEEFILRQTTTCVTALPHGLNFKHIVGAALMGGIGFTMSIFIAELGFAHHAEYLLMAKTGVLLASVLAGVSGFLWLYLTYEKSGN